ncbi:DUF1800 domain-containing protein [Chryseosolibacter indicus]|uniref:DUF1800 family protein n=1 Tax=Chryseosolibacter indicus TaxID=2782351 RepID=A0ABS5VWJ7_9BACT|nr:DUF1800 domain-containing protein [Chryseosolibacter indicus]MBT1705202.1 DUF1800 family protein [Chryseosolibacter indicus]
MALPELQGTTLGLKRAAHLLRRATFGATKDQIASFSNLTAQSAVDLLFPKNITLPDPEPPIDPATGQEWVTTGTTGANSEDFELENYFLGWFVAQMMSAGVDNSMALAWSARERIVYFLHTHFTTIKSRVSSSRALYFQNQLLRLFALDGVNPDPEINFKTLTVKISVDNAMLRLLDGGLNVKGAVNENYARELHELYSIGRGLEGVVGTTPADGDYIVYTEEDIQAAARVLSGWDFDDTFENLDPDTGLPRGKVKGNPTNASQHDNTPKQFSARFNNNIIQPDQTLLNGTLPTEESALDEIRQLVDQIYSSPETAKNICRKIYRFFVWAPHTRNEMDPIENTIINEMANTFRDNGYKIQPVIENLLRSVHFYEAAGGVTDDNFGGIIKSPVDLIISTLKMFEVKLPDMVNNTEEFYMTTEEILGRINSMGMSFFEPYDVAGYEAYHQFPVYHRYWITPNALANRYDFIRTLITTGRQAMLKANVYDFITKHFAAEAGNVTQLINALAAHLLPVPYYNEPTNDPGLTDARINYFKKALLSEFTETYWQTMIWPGNNIEDKTIALEKLLNAMLQSPEYQLA